MQIDTAFPILDQTELAYLAQIGISRSFSDGEVLLGSVVESLHGERRLTQVEVRNLRTGDRRRFDCAGGFSFVGAKPHTEWLDDGFAEDEHGFRRTGAPVANDPRWQAGRQPCELETRRPGIFAAGDVRSGTTKRCAYAAGDGALGITCVHWYLAQSA